jgi:hypothetical protein
VYGNPLRYIDPSGHDPKCGPDGIYCDNDPTNDADYDFWISPVKPLIRGEGYDYTNKHPFIDLNPDSPNNPNPEIVASTYGVVYGSTSCAIDPCRGKSFYTNDGYGNVVVIGYRYEYLPADIQALIPDGSTVFILYAHMNEPSDLEVGDTVVPGQIIGHVGTSGHSSGVHLHMEIRVENDVEFPLGNFRDATGWTNVHYTWHNPNLMVPQNPYNFFPIE